MIAPDRVGLAPVSGPCLQPFMGRDSGALPALVMVSSGIMAARFFAGESEKENRRPSPQPRDYHPLGRVRPRRLPIVFLGDGRRSSGKVARAHNRKIAPLPEGYAWGNFVSFFPGTGDTEEEEKPPESLSEGSSPGEGYQRGPYYQNPRGQEVRSSPSRWGTTVM
jgi:hypothetical protein